MEKAFIIKNIIRIIIEEEIPSKCLFDAHLIIDKLVKDHSDVYLKEFRATKFTNTERYHSYLSKLIDSFDGKLIKRQPFKSYSLNIRKSYDPVTCWIKK